MKLTDKEYGRLKSLLDARENCRRDITDTELLQNIEEFYKEEIKDFFENCKKIRIFNNHGYPLNCNMDLNNQQRYLF